MGKRQFTATQPQPVTNLNDLCVETDAGYRKPLDWTCPWVHPEHRIGT